MAPQPIQPERHLVSIVVLGDFNPAIFTPLWFSTNGLWPIEDTDLDDIQVVSKQVSAFSLGRAIGKIQVQVDDSKLGIASFDYMLAPDLRDLTNGALSILEHTPLRAIGFNLECVFRIGSKPEWHNIGDGLVPKGKWKEILDDPGMARVVVVGKRPDCTASKIEIRIQPVQECVVSVSVNQHYQLESEQRPDPRSRHAEAIRALESDWHSFLRFAQESAAKLIETNPKSST